VAAVTTKMNANRNVTAFHLAMDGIGRLIALMMGDWKVLALSLDCVIDGADEPLTNDKETPERVHVKSMAVCFTEQRFTEQRSGAKRQGEKKIYLVLLSLSLSLSLDL
jgi:hypothetical protein